MKRTTGIILLLFMGAAADAHARVYEGMDPDTPNWGVVPGVVVVKLKADVEPRSYRAGATGLSVLDQVADDVRATDFHRVFPAERRPVTGSPLVDLTRFYRLEFSAVRDPALVAEEIANDPAVELAEVVTWHTVDQFIPNDPEFADQWHLREGDTADNDIDAPEAWDVQTGDPDVIIAIFDTGVLWFHPDLRNQIWVNPGEDLDGDGEVMDPDDVNGIDDDGNGKVDDFIGWDFVVTASSCADGEDCGAADNDPVDFNGHGTHVAGTAASATNNSTYGSGVAGGRYPLQRGCLIMPCRMGWHTRDGRGAGRMDYVAEGVNYAVANGAKIGNLSYRASSSAVLAAALVNAFANGFIFTKSAGNDNQAIPDDFDNFLSTIAVAATTRSDTKASFSDYGLWVDISAPGVGIWGPYGGGGSVSWASLNGTSFAAPIVAGCAALIYANNPAFTKAQVESTLFVTADTIYHLNPGYINLLGSGRVNIGNALLTLPSAAFGASIALPPAASAASASVLTPDSPLVGHAPLTVQFTDESPGSPTSWLWDFGDGDTSPDQNAEHTYGEVGLFDVRLDATHAEGTGRKRHQLAVLVQADTTWQVNGKNCPGRKATVEIHLTNALEVHSLVLPLSYKGVGELVLNSWSFAGTRVEYFEELDRPYSSSSNQFSVFRLTANKGGGAPPLAPGTGPILKLNFTMADGVPPDTLSPVDTISPLNYSYKATTTHGVTYLPAWRVGGVDILSYCRGDVDLSSATNSADIIFLVNHVFKSGPMSTDPWTMDVDVNGSVTAADIIFLVNYVFKSGPAPQ